MWVSTFLDLVESFLNVCMHAAGRNLQCSSERPPCKITISGSRCPSANPLSHTMASQCPPCMQKITQRSLVLMPAHNLLERMKESEENQRIKKGKVYVLRKHSHVSGTRTHPHRCTRYFNTSAPIKFPGSSISKQHSIKSNIACTEFIDLGLSLAVPRTSVAHQHMAFAHTTGVDFVPFR